MARPAYTIDPAKNDAVHRLASAIVEAGAGTLLENADGVVMRLVQTGGGNLPVAVCESGYQRASYLSPVQHYLSYPIEEIAKRSRLWNVRRLKAVLSPLYIIAQLGALDRVVYPNHWLTVSRPSLKLDRRGIIELVSGLIRTYPDHAIVFSNVVPALSRRNYDDLIGAGCEMVPSRRVWIFDSARPMAGKAFRNIRMTLNKEHRLLEKTNPRSVTGRDALLPHVEHMTALYRLLYIQKYSQLNPQYTVDFFRVMLDSDLIQSTGWYDLDGRLETFLLQLIDPSNIIWSLAGYDPHLSKERGLTRLGSAHDIAYVKGTRGIFQWGGGSDEYKRSRGAIPTQEFDAVYIAHLSYRRRLTWRLLARLREIKAPLEIRWEKVQRRGFHGDKPPP